MLKPFFLFLAMFWVLGGCFPLFYEIFRTNCRELPKDTVEAAKDEEVSGAAEEEEEWETVSEDSDDGEGKIKQLRPKPKKSVFLCGLSFCFLFICYFVVLLLSCTITLLILPNPLSSSDIFVSHIRCFCQVRNWFLFPSAKDLGGFRILPKRTDFQFWQYWVQPSYRCGWKRKKRVLLCSLLFY